jgi:hypothetical protein
MVTSINRSKRAERRLSPAAYRLVLTAHVVVAVGWLGVVLAKLVLGLVALTTRAPDVAGALYMAMNVLNVAFPPLAIGTVVTGVTLSLGTKWGLIQHYWVATKLVLTVGVIATAVRIGGRLVDQVAAAPPGGAAGAGASLGAAASAGAASVLPLLTALAVAHLLMLGAATVLSVYKPWGKTWFARRQGAEPLRRAA